MDRILLVSRFQLESHKVCKHYHFQCFLIAAWSLFVTKWLFLVFSSSVKIDMISSSDVFGGLPSKSLKCFSFTRSSWLDTFNLDLLQQFFLPLTSLMIFHVTVAFCSSLCFWQVSSGLFQRNRLCSRFFKCYLKVVICCICRITHCGVL